MTCITNSSIWRILFSIPLTSGTRGGTELRDDRHVEQRLVALPHRRHGPGSYRQPGPHHGVGTHKSFINAFGEELMEENAEQALAETCARHYAEIANYTAAPVYASDKKAWPSPMDCRMEQGTFRYVGLRRRSRQLVAPPEFRLRCQTQEHHFSRPP